MAFYFSLRVEHICMYKPVMSTLMVGYVFQEYPKWVGSLLVQDAAEEKTLRVAMAQAAVETRPTNLGRPPSAVALRMRRTRERKKEGRRAINSGRDLSRRRSKKAARRPAASLRQPRRGLTRSMTMSLAAGGLRRGSFSAASASASTR
jgi:hypothetical protein